VDDAKTASFNKLKQIISEAVSVDDTKTLRLQKQFYRSCRDLAAIEADNDTTFWGLITQLGGWPVVSGNNWNESSFDFGELMVNLREVGLQHDWFLDIFVYSNLGESTILEVSFYACL
jgi:membrane metallo-endopeptidase-like protein 1